MCITRTALGFLGSPPQVRGKRSEAVLMPKKVQDHPRRCGENFLPLKPHLAAAGSPPQVRGKRFQAEKQPQGSRITPADAGKTKACSLSTNTAWDHPRGCGENILRASSFTSGLGSPPRMRGKLSIVRRRKQFAGITPADAGKTHTFAGWKVLG